MEVVAKDGVAVKKGQVLFRLGGPVLDHEMAAARSLAESAKRRLGLASEVLARKKASSDAKLVDMNELALAEAAAAFDYGYPQAGARRST
jgi:multidrug resistance efflux pump